MAVPGSVWVSSKDLYDGYVTNHPNEKPLSKAAVGQIMPLLFDIKVVHVNGPSRYSGIRRRFNTSEPIDINKVTEIAENCKFIKMKESSNSVSYSCYSDYKVNSHDYMKTVTVDVTTRDIDLTLGGKSVPLQDICLTGVKVNDHVDTELVFNTVRKSRVCCGKPVESKQKAPKNSLVQGWLVPGDENQQMRVTARNCQVIAAFTSFSSVCKNCQRQDVNNTNQTKQRQEVNKTHQTKPKTIECDDKQVLASLFPSANELTLKFLKAQSEVCKGVSSNADPRSRKWDNEIIQVCLAMWNRSPQTYTSLRDSGLVYLPSANLLQRYKNCLSQSPGLNENMLLWMFKEAERLQIDRKGGLILDEMAIQDDLNMSFSEGQNMVDGLVDLGKFAHDMNFLNTKKNDLKLATHVLQFMFLSYDGFRFPFAYFPSVGANAPELYVTVWEAVRKLSGYEFDIDYVCIDGASNNRALQMMHFDDKGDARAKQFSATNPYGTPSSVTFIMDYSHNIKKLRNNVYSSRAGPGNDSKRLLQKDNKFITWDHWIRAFNWDKLKNPVRVHPKLTNDHLFLSKSAKMRNHLAEDVLDEDMLHLMQQYQLSLTVTAASELDQTIKLLKLTSKVIALFRDRRPLTDLSDPRLQCLGELEAWLDQWSESVSEINDKSASEKNKMFISKETYSDLLSMCLGFTAICKRRIEVHHRSLVPSGLNSDVIENFFCQQRTLSNGSNNNPTVHQYKYGINATILSQSVISKKSNAHSKRKSIQPFNLVVPGPLNKKKCIRF